MIGIINYGAGNLRSVFNAIAYIGGEPLVLSQHSDLERCSHLILPGVGSFANASRNLISGQWKEPICDVVNSGIPLLGICLGMQLLLDVGYEDGFEPGLGLIDGEVIKLPTSPNVSLPHIGWNSLNFVDTKHPLLRGIRNHTDVYFVHSYYCSIKHPQNILMNTTLSQDFPSGIFKSNVVGLQFHPEKSQPSGLKILKNFIRWDGLC